MFIDVPGEDGVAGNDDDDDEKPRTRLDSDGFSKFEEAAANMTIERTAAEETSAVSRNGLKHNNVRWRDRVHETTKSGSVCHLLMKHGHILILVQDGVQDIDDLGFFAVRF